MTDERPSDWAALLWATIFIGLPVIVASHGVLPLRRQPIRETGGERSAITRPPSPPPTVEPVKTLAIAPATARAINASVPFSSAANPASRPYRFAGDPTSFERATDCLAAAQLYEAGDDGPGQEAVAQVVLNRLRHPAFPKTVCDVVFQGSERVTGCQFTFTCDGALDRTPSMAAWDRARKRAMQMLAGTVDKRVGYATHYHTDWVVPYWSSSLDKITAVGTHLFFRWKGWWGTPGAFGRTPSGQEPVVAKLADLSAAHRSSTATVTIAEAQATRAAPDFSDLSRPSMTITAENIGNRFGPGRLVGLDSSVDAFIMQLDRGASPQSLEQLARLMCGGRSRCRVLGWTKANKVPSGFPIDDATLASMSYAYLRMASAGLERSMFNCREFPMQQKDQCMRERLPAAPARTP